MAAFPPAGIAIGRRIPARDLVARSLDALGEAAARVAGRIPGDATILECDPGSAVSVLSDALVLRRAGFRFSLSMHLEDVRARLMRERSLELCATYASWDEVRLMLDAYALTIAEQRTAVPDENRDLVLEAIRLADSIVVRSWAERSRLTDALGSLRREVELVINADVEVPFVRGGARTDVVVYGPLYRADELAAFATALGDLELPVTIIARDRPKIAGRVRFEPPHNAAAALARARVIVDASGNDPGTSLALAKLGRPLVVSSVGGASELLQDALTYDPWHRRSILSATANALSAPPPAIRAGHFADRPRRRAQPVFGPAAPLVSVVVATHDRPSLLAATLETIASQTYPALEIVVVNDGGSDVRDVVAHFPRARLIDKRENRGPAAARNLGLAEARGTYAIFFDDDDEMFPDHIATLVNALERSGLDVAYGQLINCFVGEAVAHCPQPVALAGHSAVFDHADIQWAGALATTSVLFRRSLVERIGVLDESLVIAEDYDFWLRLAQGREWARVSDVTSMYFIRDDGSNYSTNNGAQRYFDAHQAIYAKHPSTRPLVAAGRFSMLEFFNRGARGVAPA